MNYINLQLFGGGGGSSGGNSRFTGHKMPNTGKPNSTRTKYDSQGKKTQKREYDSQGKPKTDTDYNHDHGHGVPHKHNWGYNPKTGRWERMPSGRKTW